MSILDRLSGLERPRLPVHQFWAAFVEWTDTKISRQDFITTFSITADEESELDWLKGKLDAAPNKSEFLHYIHSLFMLAERHMFNYHTKSVVKARIVELSGGTINAIDAMAPGTWLEVTGSNLSAVYPDPVPAGDPASIMTTWSGGAYDTTRNRLLVMGGGHGDYAGNEVYAFDIDSLSWSRITEPSFAGGAGTYSGLQSDDTPASFHSYNSLCYLESIDTLMSFGVQGINPTGLSYPVSPGLDLSTLTWDGTKTLLPFNPGDAGTITAYDPSTGNAYVWVGNNNNAKLQRYNSLDNTWTDIGGPTLYVENYTTAAIDPVRQMMVSTGSSHGLVSCDLTSGIRTKRTATGDAFPEYAQAPGFIFNPVREKFVLWNGGVNLYEIDPDTWVCTQVTINPSNTVTPTTKQPNGTYGRFQYIPSKQAYIGVNGTTENVYIFKV